MNYCPKSIFNCMERIWTYFSKAQNSNDTESCCERLHARHHSTAQADFRMR